MGEINRDLDRRVLGEVWTSDEIYQNLLHLCDDLGHRFGGSASEHAAADFVQQKMTAYGLQNVHLEKFPVYGWERGSCLLALRDPVERSFTAIAMPYTGTADLEGTLIDVGEGEADDFARLGEQVRGCIVLTDAETNRPGEAKSHRTDKYRRAVEAGALACVFVNRNPGLLHITGALYARHPHGTTPADHEAPIPGIGISYEAGLAIRRLAERGEVRIRLRTENTVYRSYAYNVVGDIPGGEQPEEVILLGGHYDGHDIAQGASDNAAGTVVALEVGRLLSPLAGQLRRTLRVVCFGCEEIGLLGSWHHAGRYSEEGAPEQLRLMLNLDGAGRGQGGHEQVTIAADAVLAAYFERLSEEIHYAFDVRSHLSAHSDHFPFFLAGFRSATLSSKDATAGMIGRGWGHTEADTVDKVTLRGLQMGAALTARLALRLAQDAAIPSQRRDPEMVRETLEALGMTNVLTHHWGRDNRAE